ncbi:MAG: PQQ-dependent sugar dehydrogenase [Gemmatimonadota bacterium]
MRISLRVLFPVYLFGLISLACNSDPAGPGHTAGLVMAPVDSGFDFSVFVAAPPADTSRLMIVERGGRILLRRNGVRQDSAYMNLTDRTSPASGEYGVYSIAFHPQYATNRRVFVYYASVNGASILSEFTASPDFNHAYPASEQVILQQDQDPFNVLYGGRVAFGPDGYLYLGLGDSLSGDQTAGPGSASQDSSSLLGKMLRLDVDNGGPYAIPLDNPFINRPGWRPEIWSLGLRNPWRWSFDRQTGDMYLGDVGEHLEEEIDFAAAGTGGFNYGWPITEGTLCYRPSSGCVRTGLTPPLFTYSHGTACSLTGGYVYRGKLMPDLSGTYFYGDYCGGWVRSIRRSSGSVVEETGALASPLINDNVVSFGEDAAGEIYVVMASGRIYRLQPEE